MKLPLRHIALHFLILFSALEQADAQQTLKVPGVSDDPSQLVPMSLEGYSGEVLSALRFDLEIAGFEITSADKAVMLVNGSSSSSLIGRVTDRNRKSLLAKEYTGGSARSQSHAFADDIVQLLPGRKG